MVKVTKWVFSGTSHFYKIIKSESQFKFFHYNIIHSKSSIFWESSEKLLLFSINFAFQLGEIDFIEEWEKSLC